MDSICKNMQNYARKYAEICLKYAFICKNVQKYAKEYANIRTKEYVNIRKNTDSIC